MSRQATIKFNKEDEATRAREDLDIPANFGLSDNGSIGMVNLNVRQENDKNLSEPSKNSNTGSKKKRKTSRKETVRKYIEEEARKDIKGGGGGGDSQPAVDDLGERRAILKNLVLVSLGVLGAMSAYDMLRYVESSLNSAKGLGVASLSVLYGTLMLFALLAPTPLIKKVGCKWSFVLSILCFGLYSAAHFYSSFYTLIPGAIFMGFGLGLIHTSSNSYVTELAILYAKYTGREAKNVINSFFGVFIGITFTARIWGNLASTLILRDPSNRRGRDLSICGAKYCNQPLDYQNASVFSGDVPSASSNWSLYQNVTIEPSTMLRRQDYLIGCSVGVVLLSAALMAIVLESWEGKLESVVDGEGKHRPGKSMIHHVVATFQLLRNPKLPLMIIITLTLGLIESYMSADFTKGFVTCSLGINKVGLVIICYGVCAAVCSYFWGWMSNLVGRIPVVVSAAVLNIGAIFAMLFWRPDPETMWVYFTLAGVWGVADAVWRTQLYALYGFVFRDTKEAGFANFEVWESLGLTVGYAYADHLCINSKLYIILVSLIAGMIGYLIVEVITWSAQNKYETEETEAPKVDPHQLSNDQRY